MSQDQPPYADSPDESFDDIAPVPDSRAWLRIAGHVAAAGALIGAVEGVALALRVKLVLSPWERAELAVGAVLADAAVAFAFGVAGGLLGPLLARQSRRWARYRAGFALGVAGFAAFFFFPMGVELFHRGDLKGALGMFALVLSLFAFGWYNAGYWYRREMIGMVPRVGFRLPAFALSVLAAASASMVQPTPPQIDPAPPGAPNLVLVTIDTLRRDHVGTFGGRFATPVMDGLAAEGAAFDNAITPLPETAPAHASMLTGLHPAEHGLEQNGMSLPRSALTVAEQLQFLGWRAGAFVSAFAVDSATGLDQGFEVYDDDFLPAFRGLSEFRAGYAALRLLMRFGNPADFPFLLEREGPRTYERALRWTATVPATEPVFLWTHVFEPHSPYEGPLDHAAILKQEPGYDYDEAEIVGLRQQYGAEVERADQQLGAYLDGLRALGRLDNALVIVLADHGESLGEHDIMFTHHGLYDEVLRVPMLAWASPPLAWAGTRASQQVTVADVANSVLDHAGLPLLQQTRSVPLTYRLTGREIRPDPLLLMGRSTQSWLYGVRSPSGVKYIQGLGTEELYDLATDPAELHNLADEEPAAVENGRLSVQMLKGHVDRAAPQSDEQRSLLEALGYVEPEAAKAP
ncbi:MAG: sulfatase [Deltaproteobacteria bacterium]|nr:sulfatase [Deltaproteobacteria bacterium]